MKSRDERFKELKMIVKAWEAMERKWVETLFHYKQHETLGSQLEALIKEKKDKEKVLIDLELINLKNDYMFNFEKIRRRH